MAPKLSLWVRTVPPAVLPLVATMAAIPLECGLALAGLGPIWFAATLVTLMGSMALLKGLALAQEDVDVPGAVSMVDALCETAYEDAMFGAAAPVALDGEIVGVLAVPSAGVLMPDFKNHSSRVCVSLSADHLCSPVGSMLEPGICPLRSRVPFAFSPSWPRCLLRVSTFLVSFSKVWKKMVVKSERSIQVSCQDVCPRLRV